MIEHDFLADTWFTGHGEPRMGGVDMLATSSDGQTSWKRVMDLAAIGEVILLEEEFFRRRDITGDMNTTFEPWDL
jgi:hypothetical protein